jgi:hypothetical protein
VQVSGEKTHLSILSKLGIHHIRVRPIPQQVFLALLLHGLGVWHLILGSSAIRSVGELLDLVLHLLVYRANLPRRQSNSTHQLFDSY